MAVIDVHTHMLTTDYLGFLDRARRPQVRTHKPTAAGQDSIWMQGAPFMTLMPEMWDYDARIRDMDKAGVDLAVVSLTCPNAFSATKPSASRPRRWSMTPWPSSSLRGPTGSPGSRRLPWQYADAAIAELERTTAAGAVGVMVIANIDGMPV